MQDDLRKFIESNRDAFDNKLPREKVWHKVRKNLPIKTLLNMDNVRFWQVAAVLLFVINVGFIADRFVKNEQQTNLTDFKNTEAFYQTMIADKMDIIQSSKSDLNGFTSDFQQLEAMYAVLQEELQTRPSEKVKDAMILNLLVRINLLNKQLQEVEDKQKQLENPKEEERQS